jgi:hypothetical protein
MKHDPHCTCPDCILDHAAQLGDSIAEFEREIARAERTAPPLADCPFCLTNQPSGRRSKQERLI